jgi:hypothetical protein
MKNIYKNFCLLSVLCVLYSASFAQLSEGGTPAGFKFTNIARLQTEVLPAVDIDALSNDDSIRDQYKGHPFRFGYNHLVNFNLSNSGEWTTTPNGDRIWQLDVKSPGALTINLAFSNMYLPEGAKLFIYSKGGEEILGAFTSRDNKTDGLFGTELINDEEVIIEYEEPASVAGQGSLTLFRVTHGYRAVGEFVKSFGDAGNCTNNVNCPQYSAWVDQKRSVVCLVSGGNEFCTGALVNNTANNGVPYILSANHCGPADNTWIFRFNWQAAACTNPNTSPASQSISGCTQVASRAGSDFLLCRMSSTPPANYNVFYAGWSNVNTAATSTACIHHPSGDIKKMSIAANAAISSTYNNAECWRVGQWTDGVTEPGSSGSPLFDQNKRIVGQLYGGPSACGVSTANMNDYYGKFSTSWNTGTTAATRLRDWLDPNNSGATTNDGYDPNAAVLAYDASVTAVVSPSGTSCNTSVAPLVTIRNSGTTTLTSLTISYQIDGGAAIVYSWTGSLASLQSANVVLPASTVAAGAHTVTVTVSNPNGNADQNAANNSGNSSFTVLSPTPVPLPFTEGFVAATFPPTGWTIFNPNNNVTWTRSTAAGGFGTSTNSARIDQGSPSSTTAGQFDDLITPYINFSNVATPASLAFDVAYAKYNNTYYDSLVILGSSDCGTTWSRLYAKGGTQLATAANTTANFTPTAAQWRRDSIVLNQYVGQQYVQFKFQSKSGYGNPLYIDNINIRGSALVSVDASLNTLTSPPPQLCVSDFTPSFTLTNGGQTTLTNTTVYYSIDNGTPDTYNWSGSLATSQSEVINLPLQSLVLGNHTITIFSDSPNGLVDGNNSNDTLFLSFTVGENPAVNLGNDTAKCGGTVQLVATLTGATYLWSTGSTASVILVSQSGTYSVTVTKTGCTGTDDVLVTITSIPNAALGADRALCATSETITAPAGSSSYSWSTGATTQVITVTNSGTYSVTASNSNCSATDEIVVTLNPNPVVTLALPTDTVCVYSGAVTLSGGSPSGGTFSGANVSSGSFNPATQGNFTINYSYTDGNGCSASSSDLLVVDICAGINDFTETISAVYPNPFEGNFTLLFNNNHSSSSTIVITDTDGKLIFESKVLPNENTLTISSSDWAKGVYFLWLTNEKGSTNRKLVKL